MRPDFNAGYLIIQQIGRVVSVKKGSHHSDEAKRRMSESHRGKKLSEETRRRMSEARKGVLLGPASPEARANMSAAQKGKKRGPYSEEHRRNISLASRGKRNDGKEMQGFYITSHGYRKLTGYWGHPLAQKDGCISEHTKVLYDKIGPGEHRCHWNCGRLLTWRGGNSLGICVDHLDDDKLNNDPDNLVPSCRVENGMRGILYLEWFKK